MDVTDAARRGRRESIDRSGDDDVQRHDLIRLQRFDTVVVREFLLAVPDQPLRGVSRAQAAREIQCCPHVTTEAPLSDTSGRTLAFASGLAAPARVTHQGTTVAT